MQQIHKYPRTRHIEGSRLQPGDEDLEAVPFEAIQGRHLVVEEKMDGANSAISFSDEGKLQVQSRGHFLSGGDRERHFDLFKRWANAHVGALRKVLGQRYVAYGEWLYAKHTIFYDQLPHYWMEFDVLDRQEGVFLDTPRRRELLQELPLVQVHVLRSGPFETLDELRELLGRSRFIGTGHLERLQRTCVRQGLDPQRALLETDPSELMEGLYMKVEQEGMVTERYKYIRHSFLSTVLRAESHWHSRPIIPNLLRPGAELFGCR